MLTLAERDVIQVRLTRAENAYDDLMTGRAVKVLVDQNSERVEYQVANAARLAAYIQELRALLGLSNGRVIGPMRVFF